MPAEPLISDPTLLAVLSSATEAREQCLQLIDLLSQSPNDQETLLASKTLNARLALLRGLNRKAVLAVRSTKTSTTEARQEVDELLLGLQNLYYEQGHLTGEIRGCEDFDHLYRKLPMVDEEEFLLEGGEEGEDLMVQRIRDEGRRRRELEERRLELVKVKEGLVRETNAKKEELGRLDLEVEKWVAGLNGIGKVFEERERKRMEAEGGS